MSALIEIVWSVLTVVLLWRIDYVLSQLRSLQQDVAALDHRLSELESVSWGRAMSKIFNKEEGPE